MADPLRRREVLKGTAGLAAAQALLAAPASAAARAADAPPDIAVFDARYPESRAFAEAMAARGAALFNVAGDVARLWYGPLARALAEGRRPRIAGLTTYSDLVVVRGCAAEARMRLIETQPKIKESLFAWRSA